MNVIGASEFKAKCLAIIDDVFSSGTRVVISKHGRPVAELTRYRDLEEGFPQESLRGTARITGEIESPAIPASNWASTDRS